MREPARDYTKFVEIQRELLQSEFDGRRSRRRTGSFLWWLLEPCLAPRPPGPHPLAGEQIPPLAEIVDLNVEIIEELGRQVRAAGARLLVADLVLYFNPQAGDASRALSAACARNHFGYVQPAIELQKSVRGGVPTAWAHDRHFNAVGNEIVASSLERWLRGSRIPRRARDD